MFKPMATKFRFIMESKRETGPNLKTQEQAPYSEELKPDAW